MKNKEKENYPARKIKLKLGCKYSCISIWIFTMKHFVAKTMLTMKTDKSWNSSP